MFVFFLWFLIWYFNRFDIYDLIICEWCNCDGDVDFEDMIIIFDNFVDNVEDIGEFVKVVGCLGKLKLWEW